MRSQSDPGDQSHYVEVGTDLNTGRPAVRALSIQHFIDELDDVILDHRRCLV